MEDTKKCPYCGEEILAVAKKCKHCGEWLDDSHNRKEEGDQTETSEKRDKNKLWKFVFYAIAIGAIAGLINNFRTNKVEDSSLSNLDQHSPTQESLKRFDKPADSPTAKDSYLDSEYAVVSDSIVTSEYTSDIIDKEYMLGNWIHTESSQANGYYLYTTEETTFFNDGSSITYATIDCHRGFQIIGVTRERWSISQNLLTSSTIDYNFSCNVTSENADLELAEYLLSSFRVAASFKTTTVTRLNRISYNEVQEVSEFGNTTYYRKVQ